MGLNLSDSARNLLRMRYLRRDEEGRVIETEEELFWRVARAVAAAEDAFPGPARSGEIAEEFYELMTSLRFLPNTPALINAGTDLGQLFACFVLPVPDSLDGIFGAVRDAAKIQ